MESGETASWSNFRSAVQYTYGEGVVGLVEDGPAGGLGWKVGDGVPASISVEIPEDPPGGKLKLTEAEFLESLKNPVDREVATRILDWASKHAEIRPAGSTIGILVPFSTTPNGLR